MTEGDVTEVFGAFSQVLEGQHGQRAKHIFSSRSADRGKSGAALWKCKSLGDRCIINSQCCSGRCVNSQRCATPMPWTGGVAAP
mmetsp:Transcript_158448/g.508268  ORF Transcript_158448/g.508268 Transcript_158448/m.508268 type:complete len:84 (-) Transcript_158448:119-370(-)